MISRLSYSHARLLILCCLVQLNPAALGQDATLTGKLQAKLELLQKQAQVPGVSAAVVLADGKCLGLAVGWADREAQRPMTPDTLLLQGSVGKTYVAAVVLQLVHENKLGLTDPISKYLGQESWFGHLPNGPEINVRMLLNHTSGLVRYEFQRQFTEDLSKQPAKTWKPEELISYILDTKAPFPAGKSWQYSDTNYIVLGMILEKITGKPYYEEARRRLLGPLGLKQTVPTDRRKIPGLAQGYAGKQNPFGGKEQMLSSDGEMIINPQFEWTGGGMASSASDLARWGKHLYEGNVIDASLKPVMLEGVAAPMLGRDAQYGLGVILHPTALGKTYGHSGFFPGYLAELMYWPEHRLAVAVQVNTSDVRHVKPALIRWCVELASEVVKKGND